LVAASGGSEFGGLEETQTLTVKVQPARVRVDSLSQLDRAPDAALSARPENPGQATLRPLQQGTSLHLLGAITMAERHLTVRRQLAASCPSVWAVFADFPNLADHWSGLKASRPIGDQNRGVGARRQVNLKPVGALVETVTAWEEGRTIATTNQPSALVPFKQAESRLTLEPDNRGTAITFDYRYVPRGGPIGRLTGPVIDRRLRTDFESMLAAIEEAALSRRSPSSSSVT
jgi:hypothetical protein